MSDLDYSPALNEDGTEFDIVKAAEIAKGLPADEFPLTHLAARAHDAGLRAALERLLDMCELLHPEAAIAIQAERVRAALASSPAPAGLPPRMMSLPPTQPLSADEESYLREKRDVGYIDPSMIVHAIDRLLATLDATRAALASSPAPAGLDEELRQVVTDWAIPALLDFAKINPGAEEVVRLLRAATRPTEDAGERP